MAKPKYVKTRILMRRDTFNNWLIKNPILLPGQIGYDLTLKKCKIGDGANHWVDLPYFMLQNTAINIDSLEQDDIIILNCGSATEVT